MFVFVFLHVPKSNKLVKAFDRIVGLRPAVILSKHPALQKYIKEDVLLYYEWEYISFKKMFNGTM